jgi:hypothetical protein
MGAAELPQHRQDCLTLLRGCEKFDRISTTKGALKWQANAGIAAAQATAIAAYIRRLVATRSSEIME